MNYLGKRAIVLNDKGLIKKVIKLSELSIQEKRRLIETNDLIFPGFTDLHIHLAQYKAMKKFNGNLLKWLKGIFKFEDQMKEKEFALKTSEEFFDSMIKNGTTSCLAYSSIHKNATDIAFKEAKNRNIYKRIGKMMMDQNCPDFLKEKTEKSLSDSMALYKKWNNKGKMQYVFTPRFALSCTKELMKGVGRISRKLNPLIQTHLNENLKEKEIATKMHFMC